MEKIQSNEIEQVSGGTFKEQRDIREFIDRVFRERVPFPMPVPNPSW